MLQVSVPTSACVADINDAEAAITARTIAKEKRMISEEVIWDEIYLVY
jgi:hypothetical protein